MILAIFTSEVQLIFRYLVGVRVPGDRCWDKNSPVSALLRSALRKPGKGVREGEEMRQG